jgi:hypothetical protein
MELKTASEIDLEVCRQARSLRQKGTSWEEIAEQLSLDPVFAKKAAKKWTKKCFEQHRCERCGCKLNSYNSTSLCSPCRPIVHPNNDDRGLPPEIISKADTDALDGLKRFLANAKEYDIENDLLEPDPAFEELQSESA